MREATITRQTKETDIKLRLRLDTRTGTDYEGISTGIGFFDHMLTAFSFHGGFNLAVEAKGDTHIDMHHTVEDVGIVLGQALAKALGDAEGIERFGSAFVPMDESLAFCCLDISRRPFLVCDVPLSPSVSMQGFDHMLIEEFFRAVAINAGLTLHLKVEYGTNPHHMTEALFKAFGRALRTAVKITSSGQQSSKGVL